MGTAAEGIADLRGNMAESLDFIFERANSALITQDFEYAERLLTNVLRKHSNISPNDKEKIENLLARIYGDEGDLERALTAYLRLYEKEPDNTEIMLNLGRIYRHMQRYEEALAILKKTQQINGDTDEVLYSLAKTYKRMHNYDKAAEYFLRAIEIKPDHAHAYDRLGNLYNFTGETDKAIETYKNGLRVDPNHPYLNFHLARLLHWQKRYEESIVYYNSALRINPAWGEVLSGVAAVYLELGKFDDALNTYRSLLRIKGESSLLYTEFGCLFEKKELLQEAEQYYRDALAIDPSYAPAAFALTRLLQTRQQYDEALSILLAAEAATENADNHPLRLKAIQMCMYAKDYAKASELFGRLDEDHRNDIDTLKLRGQLYALTGDIEEAENTFKKILEAAPSAIEFRCELAEQYLLAHKYEQAREQLKLFLKQRPTDIPALMALGKTEEMLNNTRAAYQEYQKVLEFKPDAIEARSAISRLFQKSGDTIEALKTANEILNMQSAAEAGDHTIGLAESLDLYEQAAQSYMVDPLLTKNLEQLHGDKDAHLYLSPAELEPEDTSTPAASSLKDAVSSEQNLPFELLIEDDEELEELPVEEDDGEIADMQLAENIKGDMPAFSDRFLPPQTSLSDSVQQRSPYSASDSVQSQSPSATEPVPSGYSSAETPQYTGPIAVTVSQSKSNQKTGGFDAIDTATLTSPVEELYLKSNDTDPDQDEMQETEVNESHAVEQLAETAAIQERLEKFSTCGTTLEFLQDINSDIDKQLDEKQYARAIEILADRIAENLNRKSPAVGQQQTPEPQRQEPSVKQEPIEQEAVEEELVVQKTSLTDSEQSEASPPDEAAALQTGAEADIPLSEADAIVGVEDNTATDIAVTEEQELLKEYEEATNREEEAAETEFSEIPLYTLREEDFIEEDFTEDNETELSEETVQEQDTEGNPAFDDNAGLLTDDTDAEKDEQPESENMEPFILDQEQQNLLWCHAKHKVKNSPAFEDYLNTADPERLVQLFLYLRDLFAFLPQAERTVFLNSSERLQIYYIIARLSGELGLKERANLVRQTYKAVHSEPAYTEEAVLDLFAYLHDLSTAIPDQELGARIRQELERLMANITSVISNL